VDLKVKQKHSIYSNLPQYEKRVTFKELLILYNNNFEQLSYALFNQNSDLINLINDFNNKMTVKDLEIIKLKNNIKMIKEIIKEDI